MEHVKNIVVWLLNHAATSYIRRNHIKVIAVAGSIGKTSTTNAIRVVLAQQYKVHFPKTAYNTTKSVHLEMFDMNFATSVVGWVRATVKMLAKSMGKAPYEVLVVELGTDYPGELQTFAWLQPAIGVLTAIAPEHMEKFKTIESVAQEELLIANYCKTLIFNANTVDKKYVMSDIVNRTTWYGTGQAVDATGYHVDDRHHAYANFALQRRQLANLRLQVLGEHSLDALMAAAAVAAQCGLSDEQIAAGLQAVEPVRGRMQRLAGANGSTIIDDSYNASPRACKAALDVLGQFVVPQRIAVLGMMNEMGDYSPEAHQEVGKYCDPKQLDLVITIGNDANNYLAAAAEARGCSVERFANPYDAGAFVRKHLDPGAAVLFKGSQNGVFAEEAIKAVLADPQDVTKLVRQSDFWMERKRRQFGEAPTR